MNRGKELLQRRPRWLIVFGAALPVFVASLSHVFTGPPFGPIERPSSTVGAISDSSNTRPSFPKRETAVIDPDPAHPAEQKQRPEQRPLSEHPQDIPFTVDEVYAVVRTVHLNEAGNLALGNDTLLALDRMFLRGDKELSAQHLQNLAELIEVGLPGEAGSKAAEVAVDYYRYLDAQAQLTAAHKPQEGTAPPLSGEALYRELRHLRTLHMGEDIADQLFRTADAQFAYMTQARQLQTNPDLTQTQKLAEVKKLDEAMQEAAIGIPDWPRRRNQFLQEKRLIIEAALPENEKRAQVQALMKRNFLPHELEQIKQLPLDKL